MFEYQNVGLLILLCNLTVPYVAYLFQVSMVAVEGDPSNEESYRISTIGV